MTHETPIVHLVDDDPSELRCLERLLASAGWTTATYASAADFLRLRDPAVPGCAVLDVSMRDLNGLVLQRRLLEKGLSLPIVFLADHGDVSACATAMRAGAVNFLCKPVTDHLLLSSVAEAMQVDLERRRRYAELASGHERLRTLTRRERQVLDLVTVGRLNKEAADELGLAMKTVKVYRARVMKKMNVGSLAQLARFVERMEIFGWR